MTEALIDPYGNEWVATIDLSCLTRRPTIREVNGLAADPMLQPEALSFDDNGVIRFTITLNSGNLLDTIRLAAWSARMAAQVANLPHPYISGLVVARIDPEPILSFPDALHTLEVFELNTLLTRE